METDSREAPPAGSLGLKAIKQILIWYLTVFFSSSCIAEGMEALWRVSRLKGSPAERINTQKTQTLKYLHREMIGAPHPLVATKLKASGKIFIEARWRRSAQNKLESFRTVCEETLWQVAPHLTVPPPNLHCYTDANGRMWGIIYPVLRTAGFRRGEGSFI